MSKLLKAVKAGFSDTNDRFAPISPISCVTASANVMEISSEPDLLILRRLQVGIESQYKYSQQKFRTQGGGYLRHMDGQITQSVMRHMLGDITDKILDVSYELYQKGMDEEGQQLQELVKWIYFGDGQNV